MVVFTIFFNKVAGIKVGDLPYPIFSFAGLLFWNYFSGALGKVSDSLISNQAIVTKVYFPRIMLPIAGTLLGIVDFFFASIIFVGMMIYYGITPGLTGVLLVVPMLLLTLITALGFGCIFAALYVRYRDMRSAIPFITQLGLFFTPIIYPVSSWPKKPGVVAEPESYSHCHQYCPGRVAAPRNDQLGQHRHFEHRGRGSFDYRRTVL